MKILFIGGININTTPRGGEEYKNQLLLRCLKSKYDVISIDTHNWKNRLYLVPFILYSILIYRWDKLIISASSRSVYLLLNIITLSKSVSKKTIYFVVGGYLPRALRNGVFKLGPYQDLHSIVLQGQKLIDIMNETGVKSPMKLIPNFKDFDKNTVPEYGSKSVCIKFIFISRVHPDKGVEIVIKATQILQKSGLTNFTVTFFGPLEENYESKFKSFLNDTVSYGGFMDIMNDAQETYKQISSFDVMLFPTFWVGEGFPGVIIDAYIAGLPVIASDWNMNSEVVINGVNGIIIPPKDPVSLAEAMKIMITEPALRNQMSSASRQRAELFHIDTIFPQIREVIES